MITSLLLIYLHNLTCDSMKYQTLIMSGYYVMAIGVDIKYFNYSHKILISIIVVLYSL